MKFERDHRKLTAADKNQPRESNKAIYGGERDHRKFRTGSKLADPLRRACVATEFLLDVELLAAGAPILQQKSDLRSVPSQYGIGCVQK